MISDYKDFGSLRPEPGDGESGKHLAPILVALISKQTGVRSICDLGCGNGYLANKLGVLGYNVTGVDAAESGIAIARKFHTANDVKFVCAQFGEEIVKILPREKEFDLVVSSDVIEHLYRPAVLMETACQILKPGGHLLICTPYHGYMKNLVLSVLNKWDAHHGVHWDGGHIKFFSVKTLTSLVSHHGFVEIRFQYFGRAPWLWKNMICHARKASLNA